MTKSNNTQPQPSKVEVTAEQMAKAMEQYKAKKAELLGRANDRNGFTDDRLEALAELEAMVSPEGKRVKRELIADIRRAIEAGPVLKRTRQLRGIRLAQNPDLSYEEIAEMICKDDPEAKTTKTTVSSWISKYRELHGYNSVPDRSAVAKAKQKSKAKGEGRAVDLSAYGEDDDEVMAAE